MGLRETLSEFALAVGADMSAGGLHVRDLTRHPVVVEKF